MARQITRWRPDTCGCELEYAWDDSVPIEHRVHTVARVVRACAAHAQHPDAIAHYAAVVAENTRKNQAVDHLATALGVAPAAIRWTLTTDRQLTLHVPPTHAPQAAVAQAAVDARFGTGTVIVQ